MNTDDNLFDPTRKFKSNTVPVSFIPFKNNEKNCNYCGVEYSKTLKFEQKYCENCLLRYTKDIGNSEHLDTYIKNHNTQCIKHKATRNNACATDIQEWCEHCSEILYFTHLIPNTSSLNNCSIPHTDTFVANYYETGTEYLIFKLIEYGKEHHYQISSEWVKSILTKKSIQILYLPWWDNFDKCVVCLQELKYIHLDSQKIDKNFLNELKLLSYFGPFEIFKADIIGFHGITQDLATKEYILIMEYANGGNLHDYLQNNFINITWKEKSHILAKIITGLYNIHLNNFIHRDFHSGNILLSDQSWLVGDFGLSQPANSTSPNNEIYGVIPYIAPEIFKGAAFSQKSDIYSFGMIMWELTTGCKPFANVEHDHNLIFKILDGERPEITNDTPEWFANLMKKCWDSDPSKRPTAVEINREWGIVSKIGFKEAFEQAEKKRLELIQEQARNKRLELIGALEQELEQELEQTKEKRLKLKEEQAKERRLELIQEQAKEKRIELLRQARKKRSQLIQALEQARKKRLDLIQEQARNKRLELVIGALEQELEQTKEKRLELKEEQAKERRLELIQEQAKEKRIELLRQARKKRSELIQELEQARKKKLELIQEVLEQAEKKRLELIQLKKLGPEFSEKPHPKAIYTSRVLSSLISKSSIDFSSINSVSVKQEYITKEYELDINKVQSSSTQYINSSVQVSNLQHQNVSGPLNNLTTNSLRKRNIEELDIETQKSKKNRERY
ncbi:kinase-like domain-containing protein [Rhizophagus irregularis DAOM 181602=DAOM 197198]|nr:kinase-like domain-containing protein [Rhizophagus irregularis DAOM 181602=DAOM 197198]